MKTKNISRMEKTIRNTLSEFIIGISTVILVFIISKFTIENFGDETNGLIGLLASLITYITIFDSGINIIAAKKLYTPIRNNDSQAISNIFHSVKKIYYKIGLFSIIAIMILSFILTKNIDQSLISGNIKIIVCFYLVRQTFVYFVGAPNNLLVSASQKNYKLILPRSIINVVFLSIVAFSIYSNKLPFEIIVIIWSLLSLSKGVVSKIYVHRNFDIIGQTETIKIFSNSKDFLWHKISILISNNADAILITIYSTLYTMSIYAVYKYILTGVKTLFTPILNGVRHSLGDIMDSGRNDKVQDAFCCVANIVGSVSFIGIAILAPIFISFTFSEDYASLGISIGIAIASYLFFANYSIQTSVDVSGRFKETKYISMFDAIINILLSIIFINTWAKDDIIIGLLAATIIGAFIKLILTSWYVHKHIAGRTVIIFKKIATYCFIIITAIVIYNNGKDTESFNYEWLLSKLIMNASISIIFGTAIIAIWIQEIKIILKSIKDK